MVIPQARVYSVVFTSLEDRDRVRIAMRFFEQEQADAQREREHRIGARQTSPARVAIDAA